MSFYVVFQKEMDRGKLLPRFSILPDKPDHDHRVYLLDEGDCIDAANLYWGDESMTWTRIELYRISNVGEVPRTEFLETYTMPYVR